MANYKDYLLLHVIIFLWGFTGIIGKLLHQDALVIVWYRLLIASFGLFVFLWYTKGFLRIHWRNLLAVIGIGLVVALHWITFYYAIQISTASLGILCLSTTTVHVVWLEPLILGSPFRWKKMVLSLLVVIVVTLIASDLHGQILKALFIGLLSALLAGVFSVSNGKLAQTIAAPVLSFVELLTGLIGISIFFLATAFPLHNFSISWSDGLWLLFLGLVCTSFAFLMAINLVKKLGAYTVSLTINLEPVYTIILAAIILKEYKVLTPQFYVSAAMIIGVLLLNQKLNDSPNSKIT